MFQACSKPKSLLVSSDKCQSLHRSDQLLSSAHTVCGEMNIQQQEKKAEAEEAEAEGGAAEAAEE